MNINGSVYVSRLSFQRYMLSLNHSGTCFPIITPTRLNLTSLSVLPATASFQIIKVFGCLFMFIGWTHSNDHWIITELFGSCTRHLVVGTLFWIVDILIGVFIVYHCEFNVEYSSLHIIKCKSVPYFSKNYTLHFPKYLCVLCLPLERCLCWSQGSAVNTWLNYISKHTIMIIILSRYL